MGFFRQEDSSGRNTPNPEIEPGSPALQADSLPTELQGKPLNLLFGSNSEEYACNAGDSGLIPGSRRPLVKGMATHSSILAWRTPWIEEPGGLQSMGLQKIWT